MSRRDMSDYEAKQRTLMLIDTLLTADNGADEDQSRELAHLIADVRDALRGLAYSLLLTHDIHAEGEDSPAESYDNVWRIDKARQDS